MSFLKKLFSPPLPPRPPPLPPDLPPRPADQQDRQPDNQCIQKKKAIFAYFTSWGIYARGYLPQSVPASSLSFVLYAFFDAKPDGSITITDPWADTDKHYPGDSWNEPGKNLYGNFKQLGLLKHQHRHLKLLMSVGGWTLSKGFKTLAASEEGRGKFADQVVEWIENLGLDGVDIDWEYPENPQEAENYVHLLKSVRRRLDIYQGEKGEGHYWLTAAMPCGPDKYQLLRLREMAQLLDYFLLMAYDFSGAWDRETGYLANLHGPAPSLVASVDYYRGNGVPDAKLIMGVPAYGRSFANTEDSIPAPFSGAGRGSWEAGVYDYKVLPVTGTTARYDWGSVGVSCYDAVQREMTVYEDVATLRCKLEWAAANRIGGAMMWELSGDKTCEEESLVKAMSEWAIRQGGGIENSPNHLCYPRSIYDNVRKGFPQ